MGTYKIIGADQKEYGPATADQLRQWIRANRANAQTLAQAEAESEWRPLAAFAEFALDLGLPIPTISPIVSSPDLSPAPLDRPTYTQGILGQNQALDVGRCFRRSYELVRANFRLLAGANILVLLILLACTAVPVAGPIAFMVISGPLYGGLFWIFLKLMRTQPATINDLFEGFQQTFAPLMLAQIVMAVITTLSAFFFLLAVVLVTASHSAIVLSMAGTMALVGILPALYLEIIWMFALPLIIDRRFGFWEAMELSRKKVRQHWWPLFGLMMLGWLLALAGILACFVGVFFTLPVFIGARMYAYEDIFNGAAPNP